jgi:predicted transposase/invertase (TIGR01784 family)
MITRYLDPTNDVAFKKVFSDKEILKDFLNGALHLEGDRQIVELEYISQEEIPDIGQGKRSIFDIKVIDAAKNKYIVEMQNRPEPSFLNRVQLYASHSFVNQSKKGDKDNKELMPIIVLVIVKNTIFPNDVPCISYHDTIESVTKKRYLFALSYAFIELGKFKKAAENLTTTEDYWLYYLSGSETTKEPPASIKDAQVLRAYEAIEKFNWNEAQYDAYFKAKLILEAEEEQIADSYSKGEASGIEKGKAEGEMKSKLEIAQNMITKGFDEKSILEITGLTIKEVKKYFSHH